MVFLPSGRVRFRLLFRSETTGVSSLRAGLFAGNNSTPEPFFLAPLVAAARVIKTAKGRNPHRKKEI
jgi:hypothetical protein